MPWKRMFAYVSGEVDQALLARVEYLLEENRVLRNQITKRVLLTDAERRALAEKAVALGKLMAVTVAKDNPRWGYARIAGAMKNLGHQLSDQTVGNILKRNGIAPSPDRQRNTTWASFIRQHREVIWATDFFTTEIWTRFGLTTFYVLFFINVATRKVTLGGITEFPNEQWILQVARNVTGYDGDLVSARYLIHDRDGKYMPAFDEFLKTSDVKPVLLPPRSPNLNAFAERFVLSIKSECLDRMIIFGEKMLRHTVREFVAHYHTERNHQGIGNSIPFPDDRIDRPGDIVKPERLGGLLNFYHRAA